MIKDALSAVKETLIMAEKLEQTGRAVSELSREVREHDRRLVRLETFIEIGQRRLPPGS